MRGRGDWGQSPRFFLILSSVFSLGCSPCQKLWKLFFYVWDTFCIWIWWKINDKRGMVILKLMGSTVTILFMSLWRATRIRAFPKNAVIDKKVLMTERKTSSPCTSPVNSTEQEGTPIVCRFSSPVKFFISRTFLRCDYSQLNSFLIHLSSLYDCYVYPVKKQLNICSAFSVYQTMEFDNLQLLRPLCCRAISEQIAQLPAWLLENELDC